MSRSCVLLVAGVLLAGCGGLPGAGPAPSGASVTSFGAASGAPTVTVTVTPSPDPAAPSWPAMFADVEDGVAKVSSVLCDGRATGSGFLVGPDEVMTAAHVVADATSVSVRLGSDVHAATVVGRDDVRDLALLRLRGTAAGHVFTMAPPAAVGVDVAALGYPLGHPLAMTRGTVSAVGRTVEVEGRSRADLLQTDAAINHGNSGGPAVTVDGAVVGVVSAASDLQGDGYAVEQPVVADALARWRGRTTTAGAASCRPAESGAQGTEVEVHVSSSAPEAAEIAQVFQLYAQSINNGWYEQAWGMLSAAARARQHDDYATFAANLESSYWLRLDVRSVTVEADDANVVVLEFTTAQDASQGPAGQTCSQWRMQYRLTDDEGDWQISRARALRPPRAC